MKKINKYTLLLMLILILSLSGVAQYYNFDNFWKVNQKILTKDIEATGTVTMDTLGDIVDYTDSLNNLVDSLYYTSSDVDSLFYNKTESDALLGAKIGTSMVYWEFDSVSIAGEKITEIGTSTADTLIIKIGGVEWYLLKRP